jgi:hypothetical protein
MLQSVRVLRILAAPDVAAGETYAKLVPLRSKRAAFLTAVCCRRYLPNLVHMLATLGHWLRACRSGAELDRQHVPTITAQSETEVTVQGICCSIVLTDFHMYREDAAALAFSKQCGQCGCPHAAASMCHPHKEIIYESVKAAMLHAEANSENDIASSLAIVKK